MANENDTLAVQMALPTKPFAMHALANKANCLPGAGTAGEVPP